MTGKPPSLTHRRALSSTQHIPSTRLPLTPLPPRYLFRALQLLRISHVPRLPPHLPPMFKRLPSFYHLRTQNRIVDIHHGQLRVNPLALLCLKQITPFPRAKVCTEE